ncbi:hypothetical protein XPN_4025 [Xanthomonas arboricola pv. pruni MAFF 301427]|nr:hypothetical protein XPN_4025 [Xanthomonas arboricola pv. pruni MAFF 301427]
MQFLVGLHEGACMRLGRFERLRGFVQFATDAGAGGALGKEAGQGLRADAATT